MCVYVRDRKIYRENEREREREGGGEGKRGEREVLAVGPNGDVTGVGSQSFYIQ